MTLTQRLTAIKNNLTSILGAVNTQLVNKGASAVSELDDVATAIGTIPDLAAAVLQNTLTDYENREITFLWANAFRDHTALQSISLPNVTKLGDSVDSTRQGYCFNGCTGLTTVNLPKYTGHTFQGRGMFSYCAFTFLSLPALYTAAYNFISNCASLVTLDFRNTMSVKNSAVQSCVNLRNVIIKGRASAESASPFPTEFKSYGTLYTNYDNVDWYRNTGTNWSSFTGLTYASIQENLITLQSLGVDISEWYEIVSALPTSDIAANKVYLIETATAGTYEQWFHGSGSWVQLPNITLGGS